MWQRLLRSQVLVIGYALLALNANTVFSQTDSQTRILAQQHGHHQGHHLEPPVPFAYCKKYLDKMTVADAHQLRESYQQYHAAVARHVRADRNLENFKKGPATWMEDAGMRQGWNLTYLWGQDEKNLTQTAEEAKTVRNSMEGRIKAQLDQLMEKGILPANTQIDDLSPCIMRRIYPSQFPDQPEVSLLLLLRGELPAADWPPLANQTTEPPTGKGPEAVSAFIARAMACRSVAPAELIVVLSGAAATQQATTWAWQSWTTDGFVVPMLDTVEREAHGLNRLAALARGQVLVALRADRPDVADLLQGDNCDWLRRITTLYRRIPQLGAMTHGRFAFAHPPSAANLKLLGKGQGGGPATNNEFWKEPTTAVPFQYVLYGDYMPMSFRRSALEEVGGFDEDLPQGDGVCSDVIRRDLTARLWKSGWRVGAHDAGLMQKPLPPPSGTIENKDTRHCSPAVSALAEQLFEARHTAPGPAGQPSVPDLLAARVRVLNMKLAPASDGAVNPCPMPQGCQAS